METLFTPQDTGNIHKTLGAVALGHYMWRFGSFVVNGSMGFESGASPIMWIVLHALLSGTSLIFIIPTVRSNKSPMIWPEFRAHSILFAFRSLVGMTLVCTGLSTPATRLATVMGTLALADLTTRHYSESKTTMRDMPFPDWMTPQARSAVNLYYSVSQVFATLVVLLQPNLSRLFLVLFPIQLAAFLMTLVRKGMLSPAGWHVLYALFLGINYVYGAYASDPVNTLMYPASVLFCLFRFGFHVNKYVLWGAIGMTALAYA
jgi:hypothetical protein